MVSPTASSASYAQYCFVSLILLCLPLSFTPVNDQGGVHPLNASPLLQPRMSGVGTSHPRHEVAAVEFTGFWMHNDKEGNYVGAGMNGVVDNGRRGAGIGCPASRREIVSLTAESSPR